MSAFGGKADVRPTRGRSANEPKHTCPTWCRSLYLALSRCSKAVVLRNFYDDHARTRFFAKRYDGLKFTKIVEVPPYHYGVVFQHVST